MNIKGTNTKSTTCKSISSDIRMTHPAFIAFAKEVNSYVWDDHLDLGFEYSKETQILRINSDTDVSCVIDVEHVDNEDLAEATDLVAILQTHMEDGQTVRLVTTFDGPDCFGAAAVKFNRTEILAEVSTNSIAD